MKKLNLISLEKEELTKTQMKSLKGGGVCSCRHQQNTRANGKGRAYVKEFLEKYA